MTGAFRDDAGLRNEFISLLGLPSPTAAVSGRSFGEEDGKRSLVNVSEATMLSMLPQASSMLPQAAASGHQNQLASCFSPVPGEQEDGTVAAAAATPHISTISLFKEDMKFSCGHFTIFGKGDRERLHGHNYGVQVSLTAPVPSGPPGGMVTDYNVYKQAARAICAELDEFVLLPGLSPYIKVSMPDVAPPSTSKPSTTPSISVEFENRNGAGSEAGTVDMFQFPASDVLVLPVSNITLEELSRHVCSRLIEDHGVTMRQQMVSDLSVRVSSGPGQTAEYRCSPLVAHADV
jgi:6-pyruvoyltetrahydropterin/6-carboxytetrahydropterin synthase